MGKSRSHPISTRTEMSGGKGGQKLGRDLDLCNLFIKFFLFTINLIVWLLGVAFLALGIYAVVLSFDGSVQIIGSNVVSTPGIILIVLGFILVVIGFCGWVGALREIFVLLVIYCILMSIVVLVEVVVVILVFVLSQEVEQFARTTVINAISRYRDEPDLQGLIDAAQVGLKCCGFDNLDDWDNNIYFVCGSPALEQCGVPFSCCRREPNTTAENNNQCGYGVRSGDADPNRVALIYTDGCFQTLQTFITDGAIALGGVGIGLVVLELINIFLSLGLAVDVYRQKQYIKTLKAKGVIS